MHLYLWHHLRHRLIAGFILLTAALPYPTAGETPPTVLVLGDSLSAAYGMDMEQGWVHLLAEKLSDQSPGASVINASISGDTTAAKKTSSNNRSKKQLLTFVLKTRAPK
jgi:acyl-CoA thioesterase-1